MSCERLFVLPHGLADLVAESEAEGFAMLRRLRDDWASGQNRFDRPDEALFGAFEDGQLLGVGGLNLDPYTSDPSVGRVRHLYVLSARRGEGVGQALVGRIVEAAAPRFARVTLWTDYAGAFYERLGFKRVEEPHTTHTLRFAPPV